MMRHPFAVACVLSLPLFFSACREKEVTAYRIPKEKDAAPAMPAASAPAAPSAPAAAPAGGPAGGGNAMASTPVATASGSGLGWTGPKHWQDKGAGGMRKGTFAIAGDGGAAAELAITAFPGDVGGEAANVNRWRGQIQLAPVAPDEAVRSIERLEANGLKLGVVEMLGTGPGGATRVLGAFVPYEGATWFFKLTGPDALVTKEKAAFLEFVKSIKPSGK